MKNIFNSFVLLLIILSSCTPEEDNLFGESSANRMEATLRANKDILVKATNGWHMEYYPSANQQYGGYNMLVSFTEDGKTTVASELGDANKVATSLYSLKQSAGPILTFDTYNELMHFFSDPNNPAGVGADGKGLEGDFEFVLLTVEANKIVLQGKKTGSLIVMTPVKEGTSWASYLNQMEAANKAMTFPKFEYQVNGKVIPVSISYRTLTFTHEKNGEKVYTIAPFITTLTGYKFYTPLDIEGVIVDELKFEPASESFVPTNGATARLVGIYPPINEVLVAGKWYFAYSEIGAFATPYWNIAGNALAGFGEILDYAYMGKHSNGLYGFCFGSYDGSGVWKGALGFTCQLTGADEITYKYSGIGADNGLWYYNNAKFVNFLTPMGTDTARTFKVTSDNYKEPTWIKLQDIAIPTNTITLKKDEIKRPFDK